MGRVSWHRLASGLLLYATRRFLIEISSNNFSAEALPAPRAALTNFGTRAGATANDTLREQNPRISLVLLVLSAGL